MSMDRGIAEEVSWRGSHAVSNTWWDWISAGLRTVSKRVVERDGLRDLGGGVLWGPVVGMLGFGIGEGPRF